MKKLILIILFFLSPSISHADIWSGLIGWWRMDEVSGNLVDSSNNGNTGTVTGTTVVKGRINSGRSFNGTSDEAELANNNAVGNTVQFTMCAWISPRSISGNRWVIGGGANSAPNFGISSSGINITVNNIAGGPVDTSTINLNQWQHICATVANTSGAKLIKYYYNGNFSTSSSALSSNFSGTTGPNVLGATSSGGAGRAGFFAGILDDVRFYNRVLTASDIAQLYQYGTVTFSN